MNREAPSKTRGTTRTGASWRDYGSDLNVQRRDNALGVSQDVGERKALLVAVPQTQRGTTSGGMAPGLPRPASTEPRYRYIAIMIQ
jgi:hypothetical protein